MQVEMWEIERVRPYPGNPRVIEPAAVESLAQTIERFGWTAPILVDEQGIILAGHRRHLAAHHLNLEIVPVIQIDGLDERDKHAYRLVDNKVAEDTSWDDAALVRELTLLQGMGVEIDAIGFAGLLDATAVEVAALDVETEPVQPEAGDEKAETEAKTCPHCGGLIDG